MDGRAKVYRNIERRQEWFGLEPFDVLALGVLGWVLMLVYRHALGWDLLILLAAGVLIRVLKRGKPPGHTTALLRFYLVRKPFFSALQLDREVATHPFRSKAS